MKLIQSNQIKFKHGEKFRSYLGYLFNHNKSFMLDRGGSDLMVITEDSNEIEIVENYKNCGYTDDLKQMKCQILEWVQFWEDHSQEYWIDLLSRLKLDTKNSMEKTEFEKRWAPFFSQCGKIVMDRNQVWKPSQIIDGIAIYN